MDRKHLHLNFDITPSFWTCVLTNMIKITVRSLPCHNSAKVKFQSPDKMQQFVLMVDYWEPTISDVIGLMDGFLSHQSAQVNI